MVCSVEVSVLEPRTALDSHANQCAVGRNALLVHDYERPAINVTGYDPTGQVASNFCNVPAALAYYDDAMTGQIVILVVNQAIYIPDLNHKLLGTMQLRLNDVKVNDVPHFLTDKPDENTHSLVKPTGDDPYVIPLTLKGVASSSFPTRKPTQDEYETLPHLHLTSDEPQHDPHDPGYAEHEEVLCNYVLATGDRIGAPPPVHRICSVSNTKMTDNHQVLQNVTGFVCHFNASRPYLMIQHSFGRISISLRFECRRQASI